MRRIMLCAVLAAFPVSASAQGVPLPQPRPAEADAPALENRAAPAEKLPEAAVFPPTPSPCRLALTESEAIAPSVPDIHGPGACGGVDLVRLEAVVLANGTKVPVKPAAILRCTMASAIASWVKSDVVALGAESGRTLAEIDNFDSFECRGRNRVVGAKLSEHGKANALDIRAFKFSDGFVLGLTDRKIAMDLRERLRTSACARFMTVLGPASDWYHEDHIHVDLAERRGNYKLCNWGVFDQLPDIAPFSPQERPAEAPPRPQAERGKDQPATKPDSDAEKSDDE